MPHYRKSEPPTEEFGVEREFEPRLQADMVPAIATNDVI
jgi:hypothetical protein